MDKSGLYDFKYVINKDKYPSVTTIILYYKVW